MDNVVNSLKCQLAYMWTRSRSHCIILILCITLYLVRSDSVVYFILKSNVFVFNIILVFMINKVLQNYNLNMFLSFNNIHIRQRISARFFIIYGITSVHIFFYFNSIGFNFKYGLFIDILLLIYFILKTYSA
jgi:hypothetical protein